MQVWKGRWVKLLGRIITGINIKKDFLWLWPSNCLTARSLPEVLKPCYIAGSAREATSEHCAETDHCTTRVQGSGVYE